ncbi:MAG: hypothetical protein V2A74_01850, partial [bacterium]
FFVRRDSAMPQFSAPLFRKYRAAAKKGVGCLRFCSDYQKSLPLSAGILCVPLRSQRLDFSTAEAAEDTENA